MIKRILAMVLALALVLQAVPFPVGRLAQPLQVDASPVGLVGVQHGPIGAGRAHSLAIREDGSLWAWGANDNGQFGDGTAVTRHSPVHVMDGVASVAADRYHTMAVRQDGSLWACA